MSSAVRSKCQTACLGIWKAQGGTPEELDKASQSGTGVVQPSCALKRSTGKEDQHSLGDLAWIANYSSKALKFTLFFALSGCM